MIKFIKEAYSFEGKVLVICGISAGYVPIFALDHLIPLNKFRRVAFFQSQHLEPSVGYLPKNIEGGALGLPAEVYLHGDVVILQFRSLVRFARKKALAKQIAAFATEQKFESVVVVASLPYEIKPDIEIQSKQKNIYFKSKGKVGESIKLEECKELGIVKQLGVLKENEEEDEVILKNAGFTNALMKEFENILAVMMFNECQEDKQTGVVLAKEIYKIIDKKELSIVA